MGAARLARCLARRRVWRAALQLLTARATVTGRKGWRAPPSHLSYDDDAGAASAGAWSAAAPARWPASVRRRWRAASMILMVRVEKKTAGKE